MMVPRARRSKGCGSCRAKKVKCDESQPSCLRCQNAGKACPGAIQGSIFIVAGPPVVQMQQRVITNERMAESTCRQGSQPTFNPTKDAWQLSSTKPHISGKHSRLSQWHNLCERRVGNSKESDNEITHCDTFLFKSPGNERADPFTSLARRTTARENFLIDVYVRDILTIYGGRSNADIHPPRDFCFGVNITGIASMEIMFAVTTRYLAIRHGYPDAEARQYNIRAIRMINEAITDQSRRFINSTLMAVMGCLHDLYAVRRNKLLIEEQGEIDSHVKGLRYLIKGRGGFPMACDDSSICWMLIFTDLLLHGRISAGETPVSQHAVSSSSHIISSAFNGTISSSGAYLSGDGLLAAEYIGCFRNLSLEAHKRKQKWISNDPEHIGYELVSRVFRRGSTIHRLLTNLNSVCVPRICVLFICNIILWDHRQDLRFLYEVYIKRVLISIDKQRMKLSGSMDLLLWTLITDQETHLIDNPQRLWFLARLLRNHKQLSKDLQLRLEDALLQFLELDGEIFQSLFNTEEFVAEIWRDLERSQDKR